MGSLQDELMRFAATHNVVITKPDTAKPIQVHGQADRFAVDDLRQAGSIKEFKYRARSVLAYDPDAIHEVIRIARELFEGAEGFPKLNAGLLHLRQRINDDDDVAAALRQTFRRAKSGAWKK